MIQITYHDQTKHLPVQDKKSILELVRESFECSFSPCPKSAHRSGNCGRCACRIRVQGEKPYGALACSTIAEDGMVVDCFFIEDYAQGKVQIVDRPYGIGERKGEDEQDNSRNYDCTAIDLGTTTIAMRRGNFTYTCMNPQRSYGSDVISRIAAASDREEVALDLREKTRTAIAKGLEALESACREELNNTSELNNTLSINEHRAVLAGNTTMIYLLMGHDCKELGAYPFKSSHLETQGLEFTGTEGEKCRILALPGMSAFVGGDIVSDLLFIENAEGPEGCDKVPGCYLMIDLGTNGEMVLKKDGTYYATSAAAGPAFEGDSTANIPGTDMIKLVADALKNNTVERDGHMTIPDEPDCTVPGWGGVGLKQKHVRDIQLAKAAVYTGILGLMKETGTSFSQIEKVYLAGGFGYFLDPEDAFTIRLLPEQFRGKVLAIGNASLGGASLLAADPALWDKVNAIAENSVAYSAAEKKEFAQDYIRELNF